MISPAFVEANFETLEFLLRDRRRQVRNTEIQRDLDYSIEDYDEEIKMEPRPFAQGVTQPAIRIGSPMARRPRGRAVGFEGLPAQTPTRREKARGEVSNGRSH